MRYQPNASSVWWEMRRMSQRMARRATKNETTSPMARGMTSARRIVDNPS